MSVSYKKLFKLMIDRDLKKKDLKRLASIGNSTMTKLAKKIIACNTKTSNPVSL